VKAIERMKIRLFFYFSRRYHLITILAIYGSVSKFRKMPTANLPILVHDGIFIYDLKEI
jgi:hypothetical protein